MAGAITWGLCRSKKCIPRFASREDVIPRLGHYEMASKPGTLPRGLAAALHLVSKDSFSPRREISSRFNIARSHATRNVLETQKSFSGNIRNIRN